jgi:hypothetical protein
MAEYHVGCGLFEIYAGILNKSGDEWIDKSDVTNEAISAVALYLLDNNKDLCFNYEGKKYRLTVTEREESD